METHDVDGRIILKGILKNQKGNKYVIPGKLTYGGRKINYFIMTKKKKSQEIIPDVMMSLRPQSTIPKRFQISCTTLTPHRFPRCNVALLVIDKPVDTDRVSCEVRKQMQNSLQHLHVKRVATYCAHVGCRVYEISLQATSTTPSVDVQSVALKRVTL